MFTVLSVLQVFICVVLILLVLLHSGKDAGMSGAFGVGVAGGSTGGSMMERNLDRWTISSRCSSPRTPSPCSRSERRSGPRGCTGGDFVGTITYVR